MVCSPVSNKCSRMTCGKTRHGVLQRPRPRHRRPHQTFGGGQIGFQGCLASPSSSHEHEMNRPFGQRSRSPGYNQPNNEIRQRDVAVNEAAPGVSSLPPGSTEAGSSHRALPAFIVSVVASIKAFATARKLPIKVDELIPPDQFLHACATLRNNWQPCATPRDRRDVPRTGRQDASLCPLFG